MGTWKFCHLVFVLRKGEKCEATLGGPAAIHLVQQQVQEPRPLLSLRDTLLRVAKTIPGQYFPGVCSQWSMHLQREAPSSDARTTSADSFWCGAAAHLLSVHCAPTRLETKNLFRNFDFLKTIFSGTAVTLVVFSHSLCYISSQQPPYRNRHAHQILTNCTLLNTWRCEDSFWLGAMNKTELSRWLK